MNTTRKKNIRRIINSQPKDSAVVVKSKQYGFIWAGRAKFAFTNFRNEFFRIIPEQVNRDSIGALVITVK